MDKIQVIETITSLFIGVDERNWDFVSYIFDDTVLLDYTSMAGGEPAKLTSNKIIESWKEVLPGFDMTHHQVANFIVTATSDGIHVFCYGTATHYLRNVSDSNVWTVVGSYDFDLERKNDVYRVNVMKFNFKYMDGNSDLARLARERINNEKHMLLV